MERSCRTVKEKLGRLLDADLPGPEHDRLAAHVRGCRRCQRLAGSYRQTLLHLDALRRADPEPDPATLDRIELLVAARLAARGVTAG